jgi:hypothetical protein
MPHLKRDLALNGDTFVEPVLKMLKDGKKNAHPLLKSK